MAKIGIGITTRNRHNILGESLKKWNDFLPVGARIFIVDDCSDEPVKGADFRFNERQGIAKSKNKCLELAEGYEHIFLCDDDVRPIKKGWEAGYIESGINHLSLTFERNSRGIYYSQSIRKERESEGLAYYTAPNGCFLYLKKICLEVAGGMRPEFGLWGCEHEEYSRRIFDLGLTPKPFIDVANSLEFIEVLDYYGKAQSSMRNEEKKHSYLENKRIWETMNFKPEFVSYK